MTPTRTSNSTMLIRAAFYGAARFDPARHLAMQHQQCRDAIPGRYLTAAFYDTAPTGAPNPPPEELTVGDAAVPRDGGLADLLLEAGLPERRFDFVIATAPEVLSRDTDRPFDLLHRLVSCRVELLVAPHPDHREAGHPELPTLRLRSLVHLDTVIALAREGEQR